MKYVCIIYLDIYMYYIVFTHIAYHSFILDA